MAIRDLLRTAYHAFNFGLYDLAHDIIDEAFISTLEDPMEFYAWFLTETNPDCRLTSEEFLYFVSDHFKIYQNLISNNLDSSK